MHLAISVLLLLALPYYVRSLEFKDPANGIITFGDVEDGVQNLSMNENEVSTVPLTVLLVSGATSRPTLEFLVGDDSAFESFVEHVGDDWAIIAGTQLDYELIPTHRFLVQVTDGSANLTFNLEITNIDDQPPSMLAGYCKMNESTPIDVENSECVNVIADSDGFLSGMTFTIIPSSGGNEDEIFAFQYKSPPMDEEKHVYVYLVLQEGQLLDYETTPFYEFQVAPKDGAGHATYPPTVYPVVVEVIDIIDDDQFLYDRDLEDS